MKHMMQSLALTLLTMGGAMILTGCPPVPYSPYPHPSSGGPTGNGDYDTGFADGFFEDSKYWRGYADSWATVPEGDILYVGHEIPYVESPPYDAGYWDGVWMAYNDGYFVCYDYGFTIGFSEGYDLAYSADWYGFLRKDVHAEYLDGSFTDGYNDGFSEGRIFGAVDYVEGYNSDWLDAMWDYRFDLDLYIEELDLGTGVYGPVFLYEYGIDPYEYYTKSEMRPRDAVPRIRHGRPEKAASARINSKYRVAASADTLPKTSDGELWHRPLNASSRQDLEVTPKHSPRTNARALSLQASWLERVQAYQSGLNQGE